MTNLFLNNPMKLKILIIASFMMLQSLPVIAQDDCAATVGNVSLPEQTYCPDASITPVIAGNNQMTGFITQLIVVDEDGRIIQLSADGQLAGLPLGSYRFHVLNYEESDPPATLPAIDNLLSATTNDLTSCYELSTAIPLIITEEIAPVAVCFTETVELYLNEQGALGLAPSDFDADSFDDGCVGIESFELDRSVFDCADIGNQEVILTVKDGVGNENTCTTTLEIRDTFPPVITCEPAIIELSALGIGALSVENVLLSVLDACDDNPILELAQTDFTCADLGTQTIQLYARDRFGNEDSCAVSVEVRDVTGPIMSCKAGVAIYLDAQGQVNPAASTFDNGSSDLCGGALSFSIEPAEFTCTTLGTQALTLTAEDQFGNKNTCNTMVSVLDTVKPKAICQAIEIFLDEQGLVSLDPLQVDLSTDNCNIELRTLSKSNFACADLGLQMVELIVEDFSGNQARCEAAVTIGDDIAPEAFCQNQTIKLDDKGEATLSAADINNGSRDNCGPVRSISLDRTRFNCQHIGVQSVVLTVLDDSDNRHTCTANVAVLDEIAPSPICQDTTVYLDVDGMASIDYQFIDDGSTDNCGLIETYALSVMDFDCTQLGSNTVELTVTDAYNNMASCEATVMVLDTIPPEASCQDVTIYTDGNGLATINAVDLNAGSLDICTELGAFRVSKDRFTCGDLGENMVWLFMEDTFGNLDSCTSIITVQDTLNPIVNCKNQTVYLDQNGALNIDVTSVDDSSVDNCGSIMNRSLSQSAFSCLDRGAQDVWLYVEDASGNLDSCKSIITILDDIAPVAKCRDFTLALGTDGVALLTPDLINNRSTDNCGITDYSLDINTFSCDDLGANTVVLTVKDASGLTDNCEATVEVVDLNKPSVFTKNIEVFLDNNGQVEVDPNLVNDNTTDNCSLDSLWLDKALFNCNDVGENLVTLFVRDIDGNINDEAAIVKVIDESKPTFTCPESITVNSDLDGAGTCEVVIFDNRFDPKNVADNCSILSVTHNFPEAEQSNTLIGIQLTSGINKIQWTIEDANGQTALCNFEVTVVDNEAPRAQCKDTVLVQLDVEGMVLVDSLLVDAGSIDNCAITTYELSVDGFSCKDVGYNTVEVLMLDDAGNEAACSVVVGVIASEACEVPASLNRNGPEIGDPCSCRGDGSFDEQVVIGPTTNDQTWTVKSTTLLNPVTLLPFPVGTPFVEVPINADSSIYTLQGVHLDAVGYTVTAESPVFDDLSIGNTCFYPKPEILALDGSICLFTAPIPLEAFVPNEVVGKGTFTINGEIATEVIPMELGVGQHTVVYTFDAGDPASANAPSDTGCEVMVEKEIEIIETNQFFACNDLVNITSNISCEILVRPEMIMAGEYYCYDDYQVLLALGNVSVPNPVPSEFAGETLRAIVQHQPSGRICFGNIRLVDVTGPQITECPANIEDRFICTDLDSILNNPASLDSTSRFYTGIPKVIDNCTGTTITFNDFLVQDANCSSTAVSTIRRVFRVADQFNNTSSCEQLIYFKRPTEVFFPEDTLLRVYCDLPPFATDAQGNIAPKVAGAPYVINGFGDTVSLVEHRICGYLLNYEDFSDDLCPAKEIVVRTWRLFDECSGGSSITDVQLIEVGDFDAPIISCANVDLNSDGKPDDIPVFSTTPFNCLANITIPNPQVEECSAYTVSTRIYTWQTEDRFGFPLPDSIFTELSGVEYIDGEANNVPVGNHFFIYTVTDICGNMARDTCEFKVLDKIAPIAFCEDDIIVSLSNSNTVQVRPEDINAGSRDNCDDQDISLEIRRLIPEDCSETGDSFYSDWGPFADVDCCDVGKLVTVELRVTDKSNNFNRCISRIRVRDNIRPECVAPFNISVDCDALSATFNPSSIQALQNSFGIPTITDNCGATWEELQPLVDLDDCNIGMITRTFQASDGSGNVSAGLCQQIIQVRAVFDYSIKFPADAQSSCGNLSQDSVEVIERGCDMLAVNVNDSEFQVSPDGCYKIERLYRVINWCEYDGISNPIMVSRDADCDGVPGDEDVWVNVTRDGNAFIDRNSNPTDSIPFINTKETTCDGQSNPYGYWISNQENNNLRSRGYWTYIQFISVIDDEAPVVTFTALDPICSNNNNCNTSVTYPFQVEETCTPNDLTISVIVDVNDDGNNDYVLLRDEIQGSYPDYQINGTFPLGNHRLLLTVRDGCNNATQESLTFTVIDCKAPAPACRDGIIVELSRLETPIDLDGDMIDDLASAYASADDFIVRAIDDCSGPVTYSINRVGQLADVNQDSITLTCQDEGIALVEVHAWDSVGNHDFCQTFVNVQNNADACREIARGAIFGIIATETEVPVQDVEVQLSGSVQNMEFSDNNGIYNFLELEEGNDFTVTPRMDGNDRLGVTTFDLILIRKHILGSQPLDSPYKIIAADANRSQSITVLDLIKLQKLILGIDIELEDNTSWRFVDASFNFPDASQPWSTQIPAVININNLDREFYDGNFIAVKVGDVNNSVKPATIAASEVRTKPDQVFLDLAMNAFNLGDQIAVPVSFKALQDLEGFQFGLKYDRSVLSLQDIDLGQLSAQNLAWFEQEGLLTSSWYQNDQTMDPDQPLFTLYFEALASDKLSNHLQLTSRITPVEAYRKEGSLLDIALRFNDGVEEQQSFELFQNWPNPVGEETYISFFVPQAVQGQLLITDQNGAVLKRFTGEFGMGKHTQRLVTSDLPNGVLYYTFESEDFAQTRKMVIIR